MKVIIVGGGIGGLAAAVALGRVGLEVEVYERAPALTEVGSGIALWRNALRALRHLGLTDRVLELGQPIETQRFHSSDGRLLRSMKMRALDDASGLPALVTLKRADLQRVLFEAVDKRLVHLSHRCVGIGEHDGGATVSFADGRSAHGDVIVGADGLHSVVRAALHGSRSPERVGIGVWRGVAPLKHDLLETRVGFQCFGRGARFVALPLRNATTYWAGTLLRAEDTQPPVGSARDQVLELYRGWHAPIEDIISATPPEAFLYTDLFDRPPLGPWGRGRVTLLGDAAHPAAPFLGQGACQALEDAVWLSRHLAAARDPEPALRAYEAQRSPRTQRIVEASRRMGRRYHVTHPVQAALRNLTFRLAPASWMAKPLRETLATDL